MLRLENLFQFIVPLTFLAIWAITSLFNREAQPPPPRAGQRPPRPDGWNAPAGANFQPRPRPATAPGGSLYQGASEDLLIIEGDARGATATSRPRVPRGGRVAQAKPKARKPAPAPREPARLTRQSTITGVSSDIEGSVPVQSEALKKLELGPALDLKGSILGSVSGGPTTRTHLATPDFLGETLTPEVLRRNFLMAEILFRPPVGLRRGPIPMKPLEPPPAAA